MQLASFLDQRAFISGESIMVKTVFYNEEPAPTEVPAPDSASPLNYTLHHDHSEQPAIVLSNRHFASLIGFDPDDQHTPTPMHPLSSGARMSRMEDVAELSAEPLRPGQIHLTVRYQHAQVWVTALPTQVEVVTPRIEAATCRQCELRASLSSALVHLDAEQQRILFVRESYRRRPEIGVFYRIEALDGAAPVQALCTFIDTAEIVGGRWLAWIREGSLHARNVWGSRVYAVHDDCGPGWSVRKLARPGLQLPDASGLLVASGVDAAGEARMAVLQLTDEKTTTLWETRLPALPEEICLSYQLERGLLIWWREARRIMVMSGGFPPGLAISPARTVLDVAGPVLTWTATAMTEAGLILSILEGPDADGQLLFHRVSFEADQHKTQPTIMGTAPEGAIEWRLLPLSERTPLLFAVCQDKLLVGPAPTQQWPVVGRIDPTNPYLRAYAVEGRQPWIEWVDPAMGLRRRCLA